MSRYETDRLNPWTLIHKIDPGFTNENLVYDKAVNKTYTNWIKRDLSHDGTALFTKQLIFGCLEKLSTASVPVQVGDVHLISVFQDIILNKEKRPGVKERVFIPFKVMTNGKPQT